MSGRKGFSNAPSKEVSSRATAESPRSLPCSSALCFTADGCLGNRLTKVL